MGVIIPQVLTEDKAGGALVIDGGLRFDSAKSQYLTRTPSVAGNQKTWTWSSWIKRNTQISSGSPYVFGATSDGFNVNYGLIYFSNGTIVVNDYSGGHRIYLQTSQVLRDPSAWYHLLVVVDATASGTDRCKIYINGVLVTALQQNTYPSNTNLFVNSTNTHYLSYINTTYAVDCNMSQVYLIDGQALDPSYFGYTDPLTNTWRPKKYTGTYGTNGFYLPLDGNTPIGQDQSGRGNNWTPVNFGGSNTLEKATGALPILNTDGGGKVARVGVRTDSNASSLVLALPLVGIKSDFSNAINSGTSNKAITANGNAAASSAQSNFYGGSFYFDGTGDYLSFNSQVIPSTNGDFTIEMMVYLPSSLSVACLLLTQGTTNDAGRFALSINTSRQISIQIGSTSLTSTATFPLQTWAHLAWIRSSGTIYLAVNGVVENKGSLTTSPQATTTYFGSAPGWVTDQDFPGYAQDLRVYTTAKYTQNFIPASTDPDILPDTPSGVSYSSNVALVPSTDGAVAFDGSGDYLTLSSTSDFTFTTNNYTIECFVYYTATSSGYVYDFRSGDANAPALSISSGTLYAGGAGNNMTVSNVIKTGKWYHIALVRNSNTETVYIDGVASNTQSNANNLAQTALSIGNRYAATFYYHSGFISNLRVINGTALYTSNFTPPTAPITSVANTKLLCCKSNSSATAADVTPGTITSVNALASNFNPFTVNINTQRGQESGYCTWNPLDQVNSSTFSNGNLDCVITGSGSIFGNVGVSTGKWYFEVTGTATADGLGRYAILTGVSNLAYSASSRYNSGSWLFYTYTGTKINNGTETSYGSQAGLYAVVGVAVDLDNQKIWFSVNNTWQAGGNPVAGTNAAFTNLTGTVTPTVVNGSSNSTNTFTTNFGQKPFKFPPPAGFQPLALANTPRPTIVRPDQYVGVTTYLGTSSARSITVGFKPDLVWCKDRTGAGNHNLHDSVRGSTKILFSNLTNVELTDANSIISFDPYGFSFGNNPSNNSDGNITGRNTVAWCWKAGGNSNTYNIDDVGYATAAAAGLTAGTRTPTGASVNTKSGFSIVTYTSTSPANNPNTIAHGLGKEPSMIIMKARTNNTGANDWLVYHKDVGNTKALLLNSTAAANTYTYWNNTSPTSTVFSVGSGIDNGGINWVAYCWAEIPGFSKFGRYTGNNVSDGPYIELGFRPALIIIKNATSGSTNWRIIDSERGQYNVGAPGSTTEGGPWLYPNVANQEVNQRPVDLLSNGFKIRYGGGGDINYSTDTFIYAAFAEAPTFNLYGAQSNAR